MTTTSTVSTTAIEYNLAVHGLAVNSDNIVTRVYWELSGQIRRSGTDDIVRDAICGWENVTAGDNPQPFEQLTEAQVRQWILDSMGDRYEKYRQVVEIYVTRQLNDHHDVEFRPFPWAQ